MIVGVVKIRLNIPESHSLKAKRQALRSLKDRLKRQNLSVAETDDHDKWQRASLAIACVGQDKKGVNSILSKVIDFIGQQNDVELADYQLELI